MSGQTKHLSLFDFQEIFSSARSMAIVGSSTSVMDRRHGEYIDAHDVVVRFNRATTAGKEEFVGSRTDVVVANEANHLGKAPSPADTVRPKCVVTFIKTPSIGGRDAKWHEPYLEWVAATPLFLTVGPEILCCDLPKRRRGFSMGTYALCSLPYFLSIERLFVTGFTMFGAVPGGASHYCKKSTLASVTWHDAALERRVLANVLASLPCELTVTDEVAQIMESEGFRAHRHEAEKSEVEKIQLGSMRRRRVVGWAWYLVDRLAKALLTTGFGLRGLAEQRRMQAR